MDIITYSKVAKIGNQVNEIEPLVNGEYEFASTDIEQGRWSYTRKTDSSTHIRVNRLIKVKKNMCIQFIHSSLEIFVGIAETPTGDWVTSSEWRGTEFFCRIPEDGYACILLRKKNQGTITPSDYNGTLLLQSIVDANAISYRARKASSFSVLDLPANSYTNFVVPTNTMTDAPDDITAGGYAVYRLKADKSSGLDIFHLYKLADPKVHYIGTNTSSGFQGWSKVADKSYVDDEIGNVIEEMGTVKNGLKDIISKGSFNLPEDVEIEQGTWSYTSKNPLSRRLRSSKLIAVKKGTVIKYQSATLKTYIGVAATTTSESYLFASGWINPSSDEKHFNINQDGYMVLIWEKPSKEDLEPSDFDCNIQIALDYSRAGSLLPTLNRLTCKIFEKVVCCGDSYTAGYIKIGDQPYSLYNEKYAWPHYMSTLTGNRWENCGSAGANTVTWQDPNSSYPSSSWHYSNGLGKATALGRSQAYVVGLLINDRAESREEYYVPLGTSEDIGSDTLTSYYASLSAIIRKLNAISPLAKIFVNTCPNIGDNWDDYNQAVRDIVEAYKNTYPVHLIDLVDYRWLYQNDSLTGDSMNGHYTSIGYEQFAEIYAYVLSDYINKHISDFQDVHEIPFDTVYTVSGATPSITGVDGTRYVCGTVTSLSITPPSSGCIDVIFTSGSTPTTLTVPNTVMFPSSFDKTDLKANTTYEINILDGVYGVVMEWE